MDAAHRVLAVLVLLGIGLRIAASVSWWPTIPTFADAPPYAAYAAHAPFADPQHPAGYSVFLWFLGLVTRQVAAVTILQHVIGIGTGLVLFAAVKRLTGSPWPGLLPAAFVLLNADQVYQEQLVASEPLSGAFLAAALYATVRVFDSHVNRWRWCAAAGALAAATTIVRTESILLAAVLAFAVLVAAGRPWRRGWHGAAVLLGVGLGLPASYGVVKDIATGSFQIGPSPGWQLYGRAATFANCHDFTPPTGTAGLCESTPPSQREGHDHYLYDASSPAVRLFHSIGNDDGKLFAWSLDAIESQPGRYLGTVYDNLRDYFIPSLFVYVPGAGGGLDSELDWSGNVDPTDRHHIIAGMEEFFDPFNPHRHPRRVRALHDYQRVARFGATLLTICTLLTILGLAVGPHRTRIGVFVFGVSGFVLLLPESFVGAYLGRYTVPIAGPMGAAAGITLWTLWRMEQLRRSSGTFELAARS